MVDRRNIVSFGFLFLLLFELTLEQGVPLSSSIERAALLDLRSSLGLRSKEWPRKADPCSIWSGVTCDNNGRVVGINISGFPRTRIGKQNPRFSVDALANFTRLLSFNASKFLLPGWIPEWFGQRLATLQVLDLRSCSITGSIPSSLGNLTNLASLYLSFNSLTGMVPTILGQLSGLSVLDLSHNSLTGSIPSSFASLGNLSFLDISTNYLYGPLPSNLGSLSKLQYLNLSGNGLTSSIPAQLGNLGGLVDLDLSVNSLSGSVPPELSGLRNLQKMVLANNLLHEALPENLFSTMSQLQLIDLKYNNFSGAFPEELWSMPRLRVFDASHNNFTGMLPDSNSSLNITTAEVNVSDNMLYGSLTPILRRFSFADLSKNYFEGRVPDYVLSNSSLQTNCLQNVSNQRTAAECTSFYADRGLTFDNFGRPNSATPPSSTRRTGRSNRNIIILAAVLGGVGAIALLALLLVLLFLCTRKRGSQNQRAVAGPAPAEGSPPPPSVTINFSNLGDSFTYEQLLQATGNFGDTNLIKHGHSGDLFKGVMENGVLVVSKRVDVSSTKKEAHLLELDFFSKVANTRLVPLLGHCLDNESEKFLVYKYMPNGDLSNCLYRKSTSEDGTLQSLDWITRLKIATGVAEGLTYLHHECNPPYVHRDVQASSILLDDKYEVRLGSLSEVCAQEGDTHQSRISRLLRLPQSLSEPSASGSSTASCAYDVYCFGKVLLELITGKLGVSASSDAEIKEWLEQTLPYISVYDKELVTKIVDPSMIVHEDFLEEVWAMAIVARSCLNPKPSKRPLMRYILKALENPLKVVREDSSDSARLRTTSSRRSWNAALFGSWRHSSSDVTVIPGASGVKVEGGERSLRYPGTAGSQGSGPNGSSSSHRRHSKEIFPEPPSVQDVERLDVA